MIVDQRCLAGKREGISELSMRVCKFNDSDLERLITLERIDGHLIGPLVRIDGNLIEPL